MARIIKYRAWDNQNGGWYHSPQFVIRPYSGRATDGAIVPDVVLSQYTGLNDKHGKEIYEGDICTDDNQGFLEVCWSDLHQWGCKVHNKGELLKGLTFPLWHWDKCEMNGYRELEVVGNIFENMDLLKKVI
ncbi:MULTISPECIES: YopX family protein [Desulfitobacterium]|uniref:Phage uncharacterized protein TIGR01671 n=1 Tax=Desulfitobacterium chlororespirans DSM 11544 TaxID=1121395 RepID=A0A1M7UUB1_9FIRM|nr:MULTISPECIES: YopX family protein [Desulfitobacterium]SHN86524.1 phage uncharacterized protein TIGR01671 [Desulfitobacterium chlororespirans DSM 11544]